MTDATMSATPTTTNTSGATAGPGEAALPHRPELDPEVVSRLRLAIVRLARRLRQRAPGMTASQHSALATIAYLGTTTVGELAARENVQSPTMSRIVAALEGSGHVERIPDPDDRRVTLVRATPKARRELGRLRRQRDAFLSEQLDGLTDDEIAAVLLALPVLERLFLEEQP
jgi:DNA-binding MarR family transcriptional regulator